MLLLPSSYFGPALHFALIAQEERYAIEYKEHFVKQSFRSRCEIYGANGKLKLIVPLRKWHHRDTMDSIAISYDEDWQKLHWRSITSAYRTSPYFEFYEELIKPLFFLETKSLLAYNQEVENSLKQLLKLKAQESYTVSYEARETDWRKLLHPKNKELYEAVSFPKYIQVFEEKCGFIPNLSILDLLFNLGPNSKTYLENIDLRWQKR